MKNKPNPRKSIPFYTSHLLKIDHGQITPSAQKFGEDIPICSGIFTFEAGHIGAPKVEFITARIDFPVRSDFAFSGRGRSDWLGIPRAKAHVITLQVTLPRAAWPRVCAVHRDLRPWANSRFLSHDVLGGSWMVAIFVIPLSYIKIELRN